jgi:predicted Zn finger-like uncharacterized protein
VLRTTFGSFCRSWLHFRGLIPRRQRYFYSMVGAHHVTGRPAFAVSPLGPLTPSRSGSFCLPALGLSSVHPNGVSVASVSGAAHMVSAMTSMPPSRPRPSNPPSQPRSRGEGRPPRGRGSDDRGNLTYTECGKCGAAYEITSADLDDTGKKVTCAVCDHTWFQRADSLRSLHEGAVFKDYPVEEKDERIAAKQARRDARAQRNEEAGGGRTERYSQNRSGNGGPGGPGGGRFERRESTGRSESREGTRRYEAREGSEYPRTEGRYGSGQTDGQGERRVSRFDREGSQDGRAPSSAGSRSGGGGPRAGNGKHTLFVGNLPFSVTTESLEELLRSTAQVELVSLVTDPMGRSKGFAFADMKSEDDVAIAVEKLNGIDMDGRSLTVRVGKKRE